MWANYLCHKWREVSNVNSGLKCSVDSFCSLSYSVRWWIERFGHSQRPPQSEWSARASYSSGAGSHGCLLEQHANEKRVLPCAWGRWALCNMAAIAPYRPVEDFVDTYYMWILIKKIAKAHSSSHLISLWYQLIFCKDFKKTWKKKKQKNFFCYDPVFYKVLQMFSTRLFWRWVSGAVRWHFMDPLYVSPLWNLLGRFVFVWFGFGILCLYYFLLRSIYFKAPWHRLDKKWCRCFYMLIWLLLVEYHLE